MALNEFQTVRTPDLGQGIDQEASPNHVAQGYVEDMENADPKAAGHIEKRRGYQGYAGNIPVRVQSVTQTGTELCFNLDTSIDLSRIRSTPIIVKGKVSNSTSGDFPSDDYSTVYYSEFDIDIKETFATGAHTDTILATNHAITDNLIWGAAATADSLLDTSNSQFLLDNISALYPSHNINYSYVNGTGSAFDGYIFLKGRAAESGVVFNANQVIATGTHTYTVTSGSHNLKNHNILVKVFVDTGSSFDEIWPDSVIIDDSTGNVAVTLTNDTVASINGVISLVSTDTSNFQTGNIGSSGTVSVAIDSSANSPFAFIGCYLKSGTTLELIIPDAITSDAATGVITVTFTNAATTGRVFSLFWDFANIVSNVLCVTANNSATITDAAPQLTIWGLDHAELYGRTRDVHEGWVNHIDSYRSVEENRLIAGLGGNIFSAQFRDENNNAVDNLMPLLYPRVNAVLNTQEVIGPAFYDTGETPERTRGYITGDTGGFNYFAVTAVTYDSGNSWVRYDLTVPNMLVSGTLSTIISTTSGMEDRLTTTQCGWAVHDGEFVIKQVTTGVNAMSIWVENANVDSADFDETNAGGTAGIFTDMVTFTGAMIPPFIADDIILSGLFNLENEYTVISSKPLGGVPTILIDNAISAVSLPAGLKVTAKRTSSVIPLRDVTNNSTNIYVVRGDMLSYSEVARLIRVKSVNVLDDVTISDISSDGTTATVTLSGAVTDTFQMGQQILILGSTSFSGVQTITSIDTATKLTFASTSTSTGESGILTGKTVELDEELTYTDTETSTNYVAVSARWIPVEAPDNSYDLPEQTRVSYFTSNTYGDQPILRSTMVQNNMYFTNGDDEVFKFDGQSLYRAGLFRWQPNLFLSADTTTVGKVTLGNPSLSYTANASNKYTIALSDQAIFQVGDVLQDANDLLFYTIKSLDNDGTNAYIYVDRIIEHVTAASTLKKTSEYLYYFRLNAVDANQNLIASAVAGSQDFAVRLAADAGVRIRLIGLPAWDLYDYDRLDVQIYRTQANSPAPFYRLTTLQMQFDHNNGYIDYLDTAADNTLQDLDETVTALKGQELGTAWQEPLRAKYVTSSDNRLILANVSDYPQLDLQVIRNDNTLTNSTFYAPDNSKWLFKLDSEDSASTTDVVNRILCEFKDTGTYIPVTASTAVTGTSFTLSITNTAAAGDWVYLFHITNPSNNNLRFSGWWQVASATGSTISVNNVNSDTSAWTSADVDAALFATNSKDVPVPIGTDYNYGMLNGNTILFPDFVAMKRMADSINAVMRKVDTSITGYANFRPWLIAAAGNEYNAGQLVLRQPRAGTKTFAVEIPSLDGQFDVYANALKLEGDGEASALARLFPSRILISYPNFPEIFDNPTAALDIDSDSAIDINSADGQEITAVIPFFGQSSFGAALNSGVVVVFKTNSVYVVDLNAKAAGTTPVVQKLETRGNGCTAPYSVSLTKAGIIFANETGIYRITRSMELDYVGRKYERKWKFTINPDILAYATATHDSYANSYKLSYPTLTDDENSTVAVYNHTREDVGVSITNSGYSGYGGYGSWTTYTNHAVTGWANLLSNSYFASTSGRVFSTRKLLDSTDYRDDSSAVEMTVTVGATDFGDAGKRKFIKYVSTHYQVMADSVGTTMSSAVDLVDNFEPTDIFAIRGNQITNGISQTGTSKVVTIQSSLATKKCIYLQVRYENSTIDEPVIIAGIEYTVAGLTERGITQAASTR